MRALLKLTAALLAIGIAGAASAEEAAYSADFGVAAYKAGDYRQAKELLTPIAAKGDIRAKRYVAYIHLTARTDDIFDPETGVAMLIDAAKAGDYAALIKLEDLRASGLAHAPTLDDLIAVEMHRARAGDPVAAWRLAGRFENGEGVEASNDEAARWLKVAAATSVAHFPKAGDAAFKLCEHYMSASTSADAMEARTWCERAVENGHAGAALVLGRLAQLSEH